MDPRHLPGREIDLEIPGRQAGNKGLEHAQKPAERRLNASNRQVTQAGEYV